jgi:hypothetical protein
LLENIRKLQVDKCHVLSQFSAKLAFRAFFILVIILYLVYDTGREGRKIEIMENKKNKMNPRFHYLESALNLSLHHLRLLGITTKLRETSLIRFFFQIALPQTLPGASS